MRAAGVLVFAAVVAGCPSRAPRTEPVVAPKIAPSSSVETSKSDGTCKDARDCAGDELCCFTQLDITVVGNFCQKAMNGASTCPGSEVCTVGGPPCKTPRTTCVDGRCVVPSRSVPCHGTTCSGATPICCTNYDGAGTCVARVSDCDPADHGAFACSGRDDCGDGQSCCYDFKLHWSGCAGSCARSTLCRQDADCVDSTWKSCKSPWEPIPTNECAQ